MISVVWLALFGHVPSAEATCDAGHPALGCCAGSVLRGCDMNGNPYDAACNTKPPSPIYGPYYCGHDKSTASLMSCYDASLIDYSPASGNVWCPGFCLYGCTGDNCPGNCSADQTCNNGTCQEKACGHPSYLRQTYASYLTQPGPAAMADLKSFCTNPIDNWGYGVKQNGTLVWWGDDSQTSGLFGNALSTSITNAVQVACSQFHVTVLRADGTLVAWGGANGWAMPGYQVQPPSQLTTTGANVVSIAGTDFAHGALRSDGSIVLWGADPGGKFSILQGKTGFKALAGGGYQGFLGIKTDGTVVQSATDGTQTNNTFLPVPSGLSGVISAAMAEQVAIALKQDGTVVTWGSHAMTPPAGLKPVVAVSVANVGDTSGIFMALQVDGTVAAWGQSYDVNKGATVGNLRPATVAAIAALKGVSFLDPHGMGVLYCNGTCGAISRQGCCDGDSLHVCNALGTVDVSPCSGGTCGWKSANHDYECSTTGAPAPGLEPIQSCICVPNCTGKQCGSDGCGGTCDKGSCEDGDACTVGDKCAGETCIGGGAYNCSDGNPCTDDVCSDVNAAASCSHTNNTAACSDQNACTVGDACVDGSCTAGTQALGCDDGNPCTDDACDPATGCSHVVNTASCSDNNVCTIGDICAAGSCTGGLQALSCDDGNPCTDDTCDAVAGCQHANNDANTCDDGSNCTAGDHCSAGKCAGTSNVNCDDNNPCTKDDCIDANTCAPKVNLADGSKCGDGNACHLAGACSAGVCAGITGMNCDDGNPCTDDGCDTKTGCTHANNALGCTDNNACTSGDACTGGACASGGATNCDDGNPCTDDSCDKALACVHKVNSSPCDDKNVCSQTDMCSAGACVGANFKSCEDGSVCTTDTCNAVLGCLHAFNSQPCDDKNACTKGDACSQGTCLGGMASACNDGNPCTDDSCDIANGCTYLPNTAPCDDKNACTLGDTCAGGGCLAGKGSLKCDDKNLCTTDACNAQAGCVFANNTLPCDDLDACTSGDACGGGVCTGMQKIVCDDKNLCTDEACDKTKGCVFTNNSVACSDGNPCTTGDACSGGKCVSGAATDCDDKNPCTGDHCDPSYGGCYHYGWEHNGWSCDDGNICTGGDACWNGQCSGGPAPCWNAACKAVGGVAACDCPVGQVQTASGVTTHPIMCCTPNCYGKICGSDGCGGSCGSCGSDEYCAFAGHQCLPTVACYGEAPTDVGCCTGTTYESCNAPNSLAKKDCAAQGQFCGWDATKKHYGCTADGAPEPGGVHPFSCPKAPVCVPSCTGKTCGPDGCGGVCGTCGGGQACSPKTQTCVTPCGGAFPLQGCVGQNSGTDVITYCPAPDAKMADATQVVCSAGQKAGWSKSQGKFVCGGSDTAPSGTATGCPKACTCGIGVLKHECGDDSCGGSCGPACPSGQTCSPVGMCCTPNCKGKVCGDDGCGGSCGNCPSAQACTPAGLCAVPACNGLGSKGKCDASKLSYCTDNQLVSQDCGALGMSCGNVPYVGRNSCLPPAVHSCTADGCVHNDAWSCQCDAGCIDAGNCCVNFDVVCGAKVASGSCGNKTCEGHAGEDCLTCPGDCGVCTAATGTLDAPYPRIVESPGRSGAHARYEINPLDEVRPAAAPMPTRGLLAYVPARGVSAGAPDTRIREDILAKGGKLTSVADGVDGAAISTNASGAPTMGLLRILPDKAFRGEASFAKTSDGGFTAAGWVRIPVGSTAHANALGSAQGLGAWVAYSDSSKSFPYHSAIEHCAMSRPQDAAATVTCDYYSGEPWSEQPVIVAVEAYYGEVAGMDFPQTDYNNISCDAFHAAHRTHACEYPDVTAMVEQQCLGQNSCIIDPWLTASDPCSDAPHTPMKSRLMVRAVCRAGTLKAPLSLYVEDAAAGGKLRLDVPGQASLRSQTTVPVGQWAHVAVVFEPHGPETDDNLQDGRLVLYLNGKQEDASVPVRIAQLYEWDWGAARVEGAQATWPAYVGADAAYTGTWSAQNVAAIADFDDLVLYNRALLAGELRGLQAKPNLGLARVWPPIDPAIVARDGLWTQGGQIATVAVDVPALRDAAASTASKNVPLHADFLGLSLAAGAVTSMPAEGDDLTGLTQWTLGAWVRAKTVTAGATLLEVKQGTASRLKLATSSDCGGRGITATFADGTALSTAGCDHVLGDGAWTFLAVTQTASGRRLEIDGKASTGPGSAALFDKAGSGARRLVLTATADFGWAALFDRALSRDEATAIRSQGPAAWFDGALVKAAGAATSTPRDWAGFHNNAQTGAADAPASITAIGKPTTSEAKNFSYDTAGTAYLTVPAKGRLAALDGGVPRHFTAVETVRWPAPSGADSATYVLFQLAADGNVAAQAKLRCDGSGIDATLSADTYTYGMTCYLFATMRNANGTDASWATSPFLLSFKDQEILLRVAVAFGDAPTAAIGYRGKASDSPIALTLGTNVKPGAGAEALAMTKLSSTPTPTIASSAGTAFYLPGLFGKPALQGVFDARIYPRALGISELSAAVESGCAALSCDTQGRACVDNAVSSSADWLKGMDLAACGACGAGTFERGGDCIAQLPLMAACGHDDECGTGHCLHGQCLQTSVTDECQATCTARGHNCELIFYDGTYGCQDSCCAKDFVVKGSKFGFWSGDEVCYDSKVECQWNPPLTFDEHCEKSQDCDSGLCVERSVSVYGVTSNATTLTKGKHEGQDPWNNGSMSDGPYTKCAAKDGCAKPNTTTGKEKVCAAATTNVCTSVNMKSRAVHGTRWDQTQADAYACEGCSDVQYSGKPFYRQAWTLMSPDACKTLYDNYFDLLTTDGKGRSGIYVGNQFYVSKWPLDYDDWSAWYTDGNKGSKPSTHESDPAPKGDILEQEPSLAILRRLMLKDTDPTSPLQPTQLSALQKAGVGDDMLGWDALTDWQKEAYRRFAKETTNIGYGPYVKSFADVFPIGACNASSYTFTRWYSDGQTATYNTPFYNNEQNKPVCVPNKYPDGTVCPPPGKETDPQFDRPHAGQMCDSGFCAADSGECEGGFSVYEMTYGKARNDGKTGGGSNDLGAIALVQDNGALFHFDKADETKVTLASGSDDHRHYILEGHSKETLKIFDFTANILDLSMLLTVVPGADDDADKATLKQEFLILGIQPPSMPSLPKASCGAAEWKDGEYTAPKCELTRQKIGVGVEKASKAGHGEGEHGSSGGSGKAKSGANGSPATATIGGGADENIVDAGEVTLAEFDIPLPLQECPEELEGFKLVTGRACFAKETLVGPVPFKVEAELAPEAKIEFGAELDSETLEPAMVVKPGIGLALEVKGGVGGNIGPLEIFAGIKAAITIIEIALPVKFGIAFEAATKEASGTSTEVTDLWLVKKVIETDLDLTFLQIALSLFFDVGIGPFKFSIEYEFFGFEGIKFTWKLSEAEVYEYKVDFQWNPLATSHPTAAN